MQYFRNLSFQSRFYPDKEDLFFETGNNHQISFYNQAIQGKKVRVR